MVIKRLFALKKRRRAVSPVIAAILLIGLTVAAGAMVFFIVLPMLEENPDLEITQASVVYDRDRTRIEGTGWAKATLTLINNDKGEGKITNITVLYDNGADYVTTNMKPDTSETLPLVIGAADYQDIKVYFELVSDNNDNPVEYQIKIEQEGDQPLFTDKGSISVGKDRPDITGFSIANDAKIRRIVNIAPTVADAEIKNVSYYVDADSSTIADPSLAKATEDTASWDWSWTTYNYSSGGLDNGLYNITAVVWDYANLSSSTTINVTIDNDYVMPSILSFNTSSPYDNNTVELGESAVIEAVVTDTGSDVSDVSSVTLWYKFGDKPENDSYFNQSVSMQRQANPTLWHGNLPTTYTSLFGYYNNLTYWIEAIDADGNRNNTANEKYDYHNTRFLDSNEPNIVHSPTTSANYRDAIVISATITDAAGPVAKLFFRTSSDTTYNTVNGTYGNFSMTNITTTYEFTIPSDAADLDGIDYFILANDSWNNPKYSNESNVAGAIDGPWHITIIDDWAPYVYQSANATTAVTDSAVEIIAYAYDNDGTFVLNDTLQTGRLYLNYRLGSSGGFTEVPMTNSSTTAVGYTTLGFNIIRWEGTIPTTFLSVLEQTEYYIKAKDQAFNWPVPGYNNTFTWGTASNPNMITSSAPSEPFITLSSATSPSLDISGTVLTYWIKVTGSTCLATYLNVTWNTGTVTLDAIAIDGSTVWNTGGAVNKTNVNINDAGLSIRDYSVELTFNESIYSTTVTSNFTTEWGSGPSVKFQDPISITTAAGAPSYNVSYGGNAVLSGGNQILTFDVINNGNPIVLTGMTISWNGAGGARIQNVQFPTSSNVWSGTGTKNQLLVYAPAPSQMPTSTTWQYYVDFNQDMSGRDFSIVLYYGSGASTALVSFSTGTL